MNLQDLLQALADYCRSAEVATDNDGQVVIYTGMVVRDGCLVELELEEV